MHGLSQFLQFALCIILVCVCTLSVQLAGLAWVRVFRKRPALKLAELGEAQLPHVLVQLPVCNEGPLAVRVAASAARMNWPADRLTIQLLDDGDGDNHQELVASVRAVVPQGINFHILRRGDRKGFKAGNLAFGSIIPTRLLWRCWTPTSCRRPISCTARFRCCWPTAALPLCNRAGVMPIAAPTG